MKAKKLKEALHQMAEEGVVQLFSPDDGSPAIVGVVGALQLDVLKERLQAEYGLPVSFEMSRFSVCRWISADNATDLDKFVTARRGDSKAKLPPGPNGPVGSMWMALSKPHYGIHGTPEPGLIGRTQSSGCVRLTNWSAHAVAGAVSEGMTVSMVE